jgi:dCTP deaminase
MRDTGAAAAVSPTSNLFLGSGFFDYEGARRVGFRHGLASDVGGGTSFCPFHTMLAAYYVAREGQTKPGISLSPQNLWWQHTAGAAQALGLEGVVGNLQPGCEADFIVLDPQGHAAAGAQDRPCARPRRTAVLADRAGRRPRGGAGLRGRTASGGTVPRVALKGPSPPPPKMAVQECPDDDQERQVDPQDGEQHGLIEPFEPGRCARWKASGVISYGTSSYGYDIRCAPEFKVFTNIHSTVVDPKNFDEKSFVDFHEDVCIIPPNSFALARTLEYFRIPRNVLTICLGKSTYARCGIIVNVTPFEPEWEGYVTLEFSNTTPLPAKIYAGEGCAQVLFFESDEECETSYKDRGGKYQGQSGVTLPKALLGVNPLTCWGSSPAAADRPRKCSSKVPPRRRRPTTNRPSSSPPCWPTPKTSGPSCQAAMGPFYCPADQKVYIDLSFYETMKNRWARPATSRRPT